jgi:hypothetical protein
VAITSHPPLPSTSADARAATTERFRSWLKDRVARDPRSLHAIEVEASISGNGLGKFLRGERGARHSLTPLNIQRLAPVMHLGEGELLFRAGHISYEPWSVPLEAAIVAEHSLDQEAKLLLLGIFRRVASPQTKP